MPKEVKPKRGREHVQPKGDTALGVRVLIQLRRLQELGMMHVTLDETKELGFKAMQAGFSFEDRSYDFCYPEIAFESRDVWLVLGWAFSWLEFYGAREDVGQQVLAGEHETELEAALDALAEVVKGYSRAR